MTSECKASIDIVNFRTKTKTMKNQTTESFLAIKAVTNWPSKSQTIRGLISNFHIYQISDLCIQPILFRSWRIALFGCSYGSSFVLILEQFIHLASGWDYLHSPTNCLKQSRRLFVDFNNLRTPECHTCVLI